MLEADFRDHNRESAGIAAPIQQVYEGVLVVIPALNEEAHIASCLRSLIDGDRHSQEVMFAVVDGGSTDGTCEIVRSMAATHPNIHLLHNPKTIQSAAVNLAVRKLGAQADILLRCDAHSAYPPAFISQAVQSLRWIGSASLVIPMDSVGEGCFQKACAWVSDTKFGSGGAPHRGGHRSGYVDHGHHLAFRMDAFLKLGGYDESFSHNEDAEYDVRARAAGFEIYLDADIRCRYYPRSDVLSLTRQYFRYGQGRARNILKHGTRPAFRQFLPVFNLSALLISALLMPLPIFEPAEASLWVSAALWAGWICPAIYLFFLIGLSLGFAVAKRSWCGLGAGLAAGAMHNAWGAGFLLTVVSAMMSRSSRAEHRKA